MDLAVSQRSLEEVGVGVSVDVYETRANHAASSVNPVVAVLAKLGDSRDLAVADTDVCFYRSLDLTGVNHTVGDDGIKLFLGGKPLGNCTFGKGLLAYLSSPRFSFTRS